MTKTTKTKVTGTTGAIISACGCESTLDADFNGDAWSNDRERITHNTLLFAGDSISDAFEKVYGLKVSKHLSDTRSQNNIITTIEVGSYYEGYVKSLNRDYIEFEIPSVKETLLCRENFGDSIDGLRNYLLTHHNTMYFVVKEKRKDVYVVSVFEAYYEIWKRDVQHRMNNNLSIPVHIDSLAKAGYIGTTPISQLNELTGKNYTMSIFIPGSQITLNIEQNFDRWVGCTVDVCPQRFMRYKQPGTPTTDSLVCSRKTYLQQLGMKSLREIYTYYTLKDSTNMKYVPKVYPGVVSGIVDGSNGAKVGVFVELDDMYVTGLMPLDASELSMYTPGDAINVIVSDVEKLEGRPEFVYDRNDKNRIVKANIRLVFERA